MALLFVTLCCCIIVHFKPDVCFGALAALLLKLYGPTKMGSIVVQMVS